MKSKIMNNMKKLGWTVIACFAVLNVRAQEENSVGGDIQNAEIVIEKDRKIELKKEKKLYELIKWAPERDVKAIKPIEFKVHNYPLTHQPIVVESAKIVVDEPEKTYHQYIKAGYGNYQSPLIDIGLSTSGDPNQMIGVNLKHLSFEKGEVDGKNSASATTEIGIYALKVWDKFRIKPRIDYRYDRNYWYGYPEGTVVENRDDIKKANQFFDFSIDIADNDLNDSWQSKALIGYRNFTDNQSNKENTFDLDGSIVYNSSYGVDLNLSLSKFEGATSQSRSYYRVLPYYQFNLFDLSIKGGVSVNGQNDVFGKLSQTKIFPYIKASYDVTDNSQLYAVLDAGYQFNNLYSFSKQMPYLNANVIFPNTEKLFDLSVGYTARVNQWWGLDAKLGFQSIRNLSTYSGLFDQEKFDLNYDKASTELFTVGLGSTLNLNSKNSMELNATYYGYSMGELAAAYGRPAVELILKGSHGITDIPLTAQWQLTYIDGIKGYEMGNESPIDLSPIAKLDLSLHYQINERWGAFASVENLLNHSYSRYLNYPQRQLAVKVGATYRF